MLSLLSLNKVDRTSTIILKYHVHTKQYHLEYHLPSGLLNQNSLKFTHGMKHSKHFPGDLPFTSAHKGEEETYTHTTRDSFHFFDPVNM